MNLVSSIVMNALPGKCARQKGYSTLPPHALPFQGTWKGGLGAGRRDRGLSVIPVFKMSCRGRKGHSRGAGS